MTKAAVVAHLTAKAPGSRVTSGEVARALGCPPSTAAQILRRLAAQGDLVDDGMVYAGCGGGVTGRLRLYRTKEASA